MNRSFAVILLLLMGFTAFPQAPRVTYAEPGRNDSRQTEFEIIGKQDDHYLIYKRNRDDHSIAVYDEDMKLTNQVKLDYIPDRWINIDFIKYPDFTYMIYQYQRRSTVYCMGVKLDATGKKMGEPFEMDTTNIGFAANNKIYTTINSDDKQRIMILKINSKDPKIFHFTTLLFDNNLQLLQKDRMTLPMEEHNDYFSDFMLSNEGELCFAKFIRPSSNSEYISKVFMITKLPNVGSFAVSPVDIGPRLLDELKLKVDNTNRRILLNAFFYKERRGAIEGLYTLFWDKSANTKISDTILVFNDNLRNLAKSKEESKRNAFDNYYIKNVIIRKDGGFLLITESLYSSSRGSGLNRWDYWRWNSPWMNPMDYYSPYYYNPFYMPWSWGRYGYPYNRYNGYNNMTYYANNIMVFSMDKNGLLEWSNVIEKAQYDNETDNPLSFQTMNTGSELHFLFNQYESRTTLLNEQSIDSDGKITRNPTLKNLDKGYEFLPRFAKQVSASQMIVPCLYRNYLCFAKIDW